MHRMGRTRLGAVDTSAHHHAMRAVAIIALATCSCRMAPPPTDPPSAETTPSPPVHTSPGPRETPAVKPTGRAAERYVLSKGDYEAQLRLWDAGEGRIHFALEVAADPPAGRCTNALEGDAREHPQAHLGAESRDLNGEAVFVDQFYFEGSACSLSVLVDGEHRHAWVEVSTCAIQGDGCPLGDVDAFERVRD